MNLPAIRNLIALWLACTLIVATTSALLFWVLACCLFTPQARLAAVLLELPILAGGFLAFATLNTLALFLAAAKRL